MPFQYLPVEAPDIPLADIDGVSLAPRARGALRFGVRRSDSDAGRDVWVGSRIDGRPAPPGTDVDALASRRIAVTTMQADEQDLALLRLLQERVDELPAWGSGR